MSLNLNVNLSTSDQNQTGTTGTTQTTVGQTGYSGQSTLENSVTIGGQLTLNFDYNAPAATPTLPQPAPGANPSAIQYNDTTVPPPSTDDSESEVVQYYQNVASSLNTILEQEKPPLTEQQVAQVIHAFMTGQPPDSSADPQVQNVFTMWNTDIQKLLAQVPAGSPLSDAIQEVQDAYTNQESSDYSDAIDQELEQLGQPPPAGQGLSQQQIAAVKFALYNPDSTQTDPSVEALVEQVKSGALTTIAPQYGLSSTSTVPLNSNQFNASLSSQYYSSLEDAIDQKLASMGLNPQDAAVVKDQILFLYTYPNSSVNVNAMVPGTNVSVASLATELQSEVTTSFNSANGIPPGSNVQTSSTFANMLSGGFQTQFATNLKNWSPPIDSANQAAINNALQNPSSSIPSNIQDLINQIFAKTVSDVIAQYNIPDPTWQPDSTTVSQLGQPLSPQIQTALNLVNGAQQQVQLTLNVVSTLPPGPGQTLYLNVLKEVAMALANIKKAIASAQGIETDLEQRLNKEQANEQVLKNQEQQDEINQQQSKQAKMKPLQEIMKFLGPLKYVMMAVMAVIGGALLGPAGVVMALAVCALMIADDVMGDKGPIKQLFNAIAQINNPALQLFCKFLVTAVVCVCAGPFLGGQFAFENANLFGSILQAMGVNSAAANIANMVMDMVFQFASMILMTVVTGGAAGALLIADALEAAAEVVSTVCRAVVTIARSVVQIVSKVVDSVADFLGLAAKIASQATADAATVTEDVLPQVTKAAELFERIADYWGNLAEDIASGDSDALEEFKNVTNMMGKLMKAEDVASATVGIAQGGMSIQLNLLKMQLAQATGYLDTIITELEGILKGLNKIIQMLMAAIQGQGDWYSQLGQVQNDFWASNTKTMTDITTATRG